MLKSYRIHKFLYSWYYYFFLLWMPYCIWYSFCAFIRDIFLFTNLQFNLCKINAQELVILLQSKNGINTVMGFSLKLTIGFVDAVQILCLCMEQLQTKIIRHFDNKYLFYITFIITIKLLNYDLLDTFQNWKCALS